MTDFQEYLSGEKLYGDDFNFKEIEAWYTDEKDGYFNLSGQPQKEKYNYGYHALNRLYGYRYLKNQTFKDVLAIGGAFGDELLPILNQIKNIAILEPGSGFQHNTLQGKKVVYCKPNILGEMPFQDNSFDLITCFGVLHHIPNVTFVLQEIYRILKPGGVLLLREPFVAMGDWRKKRPGLTKRERGIPLKIMDQILQKIGYKIMQRHQCINIFSSALIKFFKFPLFNHVFFTWLDKVFSFFFVWNKIYFRNKFYAKFGNSSVYYVLKK